MKEFWTDGSAVPNPGRGGWAVISEGEPVALGQEEEATNIRMEARALIAALELAGGEECRIMTDSEFWINVVTKWAPGWERNGWKKKSGEIKNLDLVKELYGLHRESKATLVWVRGHIGTKDNELADVWANRAREGASL